MYVLIMRHKQWILFEYSYEHENWILILKNIKFTDCYFKNILILRKLKTVFDLIFILKVKFLMLPKLFWRYFYNCTYLIDLFTYYKLRKDNIEILDVWWRCTHFSRKLCVKIINFSVKCNLKRWICSNRLFETL